MSLSVLRAVVRSILTEAKVDDLLKKYDENHADVIMSLNSNDPSPTKKYLPWAVKQWVTGTCKNKSDLIDVMTDFHKYGARLLKKDINAWDFQELYNTLDDIRRDGLEPSKRQQKLQIKSSGADRIYEDEQCVVLLVKDKASACFYGANTKWCITMTHHSYYEEYVARNVVFIYVLRKDLKPTDPRFKIALAYERESDNEVYQIEAFNASDIDGTPEDYLSDLEHFATINAKCLQVVEAQPASLLAQVQSGAVSPDVLTRTQYTAAKEVLGSKIPAWALEELAVSPDEYERRSAASNDRTPVSLLIKLASDPDFFVRTDLIQNRTACNSPELIDAAIQFAIRESDPAYLAHFCRGGMLPVSALEKFAAIDFPNGNASLDVNISGARNVTIDILKTLASKGSYIAQKKLADLGQS